MRVRDEEGTPVSLELSPDEPPPPLAKKTRKFQRPTTPEVEALFFKVAVHCTKREMAILQWVMGRAPDGGKALAELFLHPETT